jgi:hypothetical protein
LHLHLRVDLLDGRDTLVLEEGDESANEELPYVDIVQGLDQGPEGPKANLANEGKPKSLTLSFKITPFTFAMIVHLRFRS